MSSLAFRPLSYTLGHIHILCLFRCGDLGWGLRELGIFQGQNPASSTSLRAVSHADLKGSQGTEPTHSTPPNMGLQIMALMSSVEK